MAGITLAIAEAKLTLWLDAEAALATSQSYEIEESNGRRRLVRADLAEVRNQITYWQRYVTRLSAVSTGRARTRRIVN